MTQMKKFIIPSMIVAAMAFTSCNDYLDINSNPNSPTESSLSNDLIYPAVEIAYASNIGDNLRTVSAYLVEYYAQYIGTSNYVDISNFIVPATRTAGVYTQMNLRVISNANIVMGKAEAEGDWATYLAATVMMCQAYQTLIDCYGETPYTEALDSSNAMPHYDEGQVVYSGILEQLDEAISKASADLNQATATSFLIPNGTAADWIKVANALKLKILMREHNVVNVSSQLSSLISQNNFPTSDVEWAGCWSNASGKANPFYSEDFADWGSQKNTILNCALAVTMQAYGDARIPAYFSPAPADGQWRGSISGTNLSTAADPYKSVSYWCRPNMAYNTPVSFMSLAEINFFLAEYYAESGDISRGASYYEAAINASFASAGVSGAAAAIAAYPFDSANWKRSLGIQKWVHLSAVNTFEGWCEVRRLKYPTFDTSVTASDMFDDTTINSPVDTSILSPGYLYTPLKVNSDVGNNTLVQRFYYSSSSTNTNSNAPELKSLTTPIFWAQ